MPNIEKAKNQAGKTIFPVTVADAVLMGNGKTLKGELTELGSKLESGNLDIAILSNKYYDDTGRLINYTGRSCTNILRYNKNARLSTFEKVHKWQCWSNGNFQGENFIPNSNTTHISFMWSTIVESARYNEFVNAIYEKDSVEIIVGKAIDDGSGFEINASSYARSVILPYDEQKVINVMPTQSNFYDKNGRWLGYVNSSIVSTFANTAFVVFNFLPIPTEEVFYAKKVRMNQLIDSDFVEKIVMGSETSTPKNGIIELKPATGEKAGIMSAADKRKLDTLENYEINIEGSGVSKNASAFGFLPTNSAMENSLALQNCLNGGGTILIDLVGEYKLCKSMLIDSNTTIFFGAGVTISMEADNNGVVATYPFVNRGVLTGAKNYNIKIIGLNIKCNSLDNGNDIPRVIGLRGIVSMYHVENVEIRDFKLLDAADIDVVAGLRYSYGIHIADFKNVRITGVVINSNKDGIHLCSGDAFVIEDCEMMTHDDPIALNAMDYPESNPMLGSITNGIISDIRLKKWYDSTEASQRGMLLLVGSWEEWSYGKTYRYYGDTVVSNGRIYRSVTANKTNKETTESYNQPIHTEGIVTGADGISWLMYQSGEIKSVSVENITIDNIVSERSWGALLFFSIENSGWVRSYYPNSELPIIKNIILNGFTDLGNTIAVFNGTAPCKNIRINNSYIKGRFAILSSSNDEIIGSNYPNADIVMMGNTLNVDGESVVVTNNGFGRQITLKILGSIIENTSFKPITQGGVKVISNDIGL